jgi:hypothetical protein
VNPGATHVDSGGSRDAARRLTATRSEQWDAARRVVAARRERWGATISKRVNRVVPRGCRVNGGDGKPQPNADARCRQIHSRDPLTCPREQTHSAIRATEEGQAMLDYVAYCLYNKLLYVTMTILVCHFAFLYYHLIFFVIKLKNKK